MHLWFQFELKITRPGHSCLFAKSLIYSIFEYFPLYAFNIRMIHRTSPAGARNMLENQPMMGTIPSSRYALTNTIEI